MRKPPANNATTTTHMKNTASVSASMNAKKMKKINKDKDRSSASINKLAADTSSTRKVLFQCYKDENVRHDNNDDIDDDDGGDNDSSSVTDRSLPLTR